MSFINVDLPRFYHFFCVEVEKPIQETSYGLVFFFFSCRNTQLSKVARKEPRSKEVRSGDCRLLSSASNRERKLPLRDG